MGQEIFRSSIRTISVILLVVAGGISLPVSAQNSGQQQRNDQKEAAVYFPLYNGLAISADLLGIGSYAIGGDFLTSEIGVEANLKNRYFPIIEVGYGSTNTWSEKGTHYVSSAPYFRVGMNYNTMYKKGNPNFLYVGFRVAHSSFSYDIANAPIVDPIFGGKMENPSFIDYIWGTDVPFNHQGLKASMTWYELLVGVRAHIYKNIYMGWSVRLKRRLSLSDSGYGVPWFVPGFGAYDSSHFGLDYTITYKIPHRSKK